MDVIAAVGFLLALVVGACFFVVKGARDDSRPPTHPQEIPTEPVALVPPPLAPAPSFNRVSGWLTFLCILLGVIGPLMSVNAAQEYYKQLSPHMHASLARDLLHGVWAILFVDACASISAAYGLWNVESWGARLARLYFAAGPLVSALLLLGLGASLGEPVRSELGKVAAEVLIRGYASSIIWLIYLNRSIQVRRLFPSKVSCS